jgi:hypothetical protein
VVTVELPEGPVEVPFELIAAARLILTDDLIAASGGLQ